MIDDADEWKFFSQETRKARKQHDCTECGRMIEAGESYRLSNGLMDQRWLRYKTCAHCQTLCDWLQVICNGYLFTAVHEDFRNHWLEEPTLHSPWMRRAIYRAKRSWRAPEGSLHPVIPPRAGYDHPRFVRLRHLWSTPYNNKPEHVDEALSQMTLNVMRSLWWGEWYQVEAAATLRRSYEHLLQQEAA
jgi:hypothetical protein